MQKTLLSVGVMALFGAVLATPASAMCGPGQQAKTSSAGAMMCGAPTGAAASQMAPETPMTDKPAASGMCPCCRNMAMMKGSKPSGGMHHDMPGMDMPKQQ